LWSSAAAEVLVAGNFTLHPPALLPGPRVFLTARRPDVHVRGRNVYLIVDIHPVVLRVQHLLSSGDDLQEEHDLTIRQRHDESGAQVRVDATKSNCHRKCHNILDQLRLTEFPAHLSG
jgi:hypothetical protein